MITVYAATDRSGLKLNRERIKFSKRCDVSIVLKDGSVHPCHESVILESFECLDESAIKSAPHQIRVPVTDSEIMQALLSVVYTSQVTISNENTYDLLHCSLLMEYKKLPELCKAIFAESFVTSRLFDIFDLFHQAHFKSPMWYTVIKYIAARLKELSRLPEYLTAPYNKIRPRCTTLFRYLPAFMEREEHLLDYIIRWGRYNNDERKSLVPQILGKIYIKDVSGLFAKNLVSKLFDVEDLSDDGEETTAPVKRLRTFVRFEKRSRYFCVEYQTRQEKTSAWHYVNGKVGQPIVNSKFVVLDGIIFNLRSTYEDDEKTKRIYTFKSSLITAYESLMKSDEVDTYDDEYIVRNLADPDFTTGPLTFDMISTNAEIYVYISPEPETTNKNALEQLLAYNCERDEWYRHALYEDSNEVLLKSCLISHESCLYLVGGRNRTDSTKRDSFFVRDSREGHFKKLPSLKYKRSNVAACVLNERIYAVGGIDSDNKSTNSAQVFDLKAGKWSDALSPMKMKRQRFKLVPFESRLWAIGNAQSIVETYDTRTNSWSVSPQTLTQAFEDPIIVDLLRPEPPQTRYELRVLDALVF